MSARAEESMANRRARSSQSVDGGRIDAQKGFDQRAMDIDEGRVRGH